MLNCWCTSLGLRGDGDDGVSVEGRLILKQAWRKAVRLISWWHRVVPGKDRDWCHRLTKNKKVFLHLGRAPPALHANLFCGLFRDHKGLWLGPWCWCPFAKRIPSRLFSVIIIIIIIIIFPVVEGDFKKGTILDIFWTDDWLIHLSGIILCYFLHGHEWERSARFPWCWL